MVNVATLDDEVDDAFVTIVALPVACVFNCRFTTETESPGGRPKLASFALSNGEVPYMTWLTLNFR